MFLWNNLLILRSVVCHGFCRFCYACCWCKLWIFLKPGVSRASHKHSVRALRNLLPALLLARLRGFGSSYPPSLVMKSGFNQTKSPTPAPFQGQVRPPSGALEGETDMRPANCACIRSARPDRYGLSHFRDRPRPARRGFSIPPRTVAHGESDRVPVRLAAVRDRGRADRGSTFT